MCGGEIEVRKEGGRPKDREKSEEFVYRNRKTSGGTAFKNRKHEIKQKGVNQCALERWK